MKLIVNPHKIEIVKEPVNEKEVNITKCEFEFADEITNEFTKEAYFTFKGTTYKVIILNNECDIPNEVLVEKGQVEIGVVAFKVDNDLIRYNPSPAYFNTWAGSLKENAENSSTPTPSELEQLESILTNKQDKLVSGTNIKTINNQSILGEGNINIEGGGSTGTSDYESLQNKPSINNIDLIGNKTLNELGIQPKGNYANSGDIPTKLSELTNDCSFIDAEADPTVPTHVKNITQANIENWNNKSNFSGNYNDLTNKPTIPSQVTEATVSGWGFTKNTGTYSKPNGGIPKSDLASSVQSSLNKADTALQTEQYTGTYSKPSGGIPKTDLAGAVQTSLGKADTALQSYTEQYTGTITGITMNGVSKGTSGVVDLGTVITSHQDLSNYELKPTTVSSSETTTSITPQNNTIYQFGELTSLTITNPPATGAYSIIFTSGATATTTVIPNTMLGLEDFAAEANTIYEINVLNNRAVVGSWAVSA